MVGAGWFAVVALLRVVCCGSRLQSVWRGRRAAVGLLWLVVCGRWPRLSYGWATVAMLRLVCYHLFGAVSVVPLVRYCQCAEFGVLRLVRCGW